MPVDGFHHFHHQSGVRVAHRIKASALAIAAFLTLIIALPGGARAAGDKPKATPAAEKAASKPAEAKPTPKPTEAATPKPSPSPTAVQNPEKRASKSLPGEKSPLIAGSLAFFPGVVVHGTGHFYAGSYLGGLGLLALEGMSAYLIYENTTGLAGDINTFTQSTQGGSIPTNFSDFYTRFGIVTVASFAFLYSWFDDMSGAPTAAKLYNRRLEAQQSSAQLGLAPLQTGGAMVSMKVNF